MTNDDFKKAIFHVFDTEEGQLVLNKLVDMYVNTDIVQTDGEVPSAIRAGKSELVRFLLNIHNNKD